MPESDIIERKQPTFISSLAKESDRGFVLVGAARLDDLLQELLRAKFLSCAHSSKGSLDELLTDKYAPLQSFGTKIQLARALGLVNESGRKTLDAIRGLRNICAHVENWKTEKVVGKTRDMPRRLLACPQAHYGGRKDELKKHIQEFKSIAKRERPELTDARIMVMFSICFMVRQLTIILSVFAEKDEES